MEYLKVTAGGKSSPKRELFRSSRSSRQQRTMMTNLMEVITQVNGGGDQHVLVSETNEDGVVRMKVMVRKQDLMQMLEVMKMGKTSNNAQRPAYSSSSASLTVEQRLNLLRRKHLLRANSMKVEIRQGHSWSPVLQSIPEEL